MVATLVFTEAAEKLYQDFVTYNVPNMLGLLEEDANDIHFFYCSFNNPEQLSRRVLVVADGGSPVVRVCIEAAYELFEGEINYKVERVGTVQRQEVRQGLIPLLDRAFERLVSWRPTHDNIWDNVY
jgi:hypothetical protein